MQQWFLLSIRKMGPRSIKSHLIWTCHMLIDSHIQSDRNGGLTFLIGLDLKE